MRLITEMYSHQIKAVEKLKRIKIGAAYMEMGTGKTRVALELINIRLQKDRIDHVIWLCPCSVKENLKRDIIKHTGEEQECITICGIETLSSSIKANSYLLDLVKNKSNMVTFILLIGSSSPGLTAVLRLNPSPLPLFSLAQLILLLRSPVEYRRDLNNKIPCQPHRSV